MNHRQAEIQSLTAELNELYSDLAFAEARQVAEQLASRLGDPTPDSIARYVHSWILIWEARGNLEEASRIAELDISRKRAEIESGDYAPYPELLREQIEYLYDSLYLQADRYATSGNLKRALACIDEVHSLGERWGIEPDEDVQVLFAKLHSEANAGP
jgi:hypothetical protein